MFCLIYKQVLLLLAATDYYCFMLPTSLVIPDFLLQQPICLYAERLNPSLAASLQASKSASLQASKSLSRWLSLPACKPLSS